MKINTQKIIPVALMSFASFLMLKAGYMAISGDLFGGALFAVFTLVLTDLIVLPVVNAINGNK